MRIISLLLIAILCGCQLTETAAEKCTRLSAHPQEGATVDGKAVGVLLADVDKPLAMSTCKQAVKEDSRPELKFRYARSLLAGRPSTEQVKQARELAKTAISEGYPKANLVLGYLNYTFAPQNAQHAFEYYKRAKAAGMVAGDEGMAFALAFGENTKEWRQQGIAILEELAQDRPSFHLSVATAYTGWKNTTEMRRKAEAALKKAVAAKVPGAPFALAELYHSPTGTSETVRSAQHYARLAIKEKDSRAYGLLIDTYYRRARKPDYKGALKAALLGAKTGDAYSNYIAGYMYAKGQGVDKDSLRAEPFLKRASDKGHKSATDLLRKTVAPTARLLRKMPKYAAQSCVKRRMSTYDRNNFDYYNSCDHPVNTVSCDRHAATEVLSFFDGKDRETCRRKWVRAKSYITNFYGANRQSSFFRKAIANTSVRVGACHPPLEPRLVNGKVFCKE